MISIPNLTNSDIVRFYSKINFQGKGKDNCWLWLAYKDVDGYGSFKIKGIMYLATRIIYKLIYNIDPGELLVCHECNNPSCCNPNHLFLGTQSENRQHAYDCGRANKRGSNNSWSIFTEEMIPRIRKEAEEFGSSKIARKYGVSPDTISSIKNRKTWKHVM